MMDVLSRIERGELHLVVSKRYAQDEDIAELLRLAKLGQAAELQCRECLDDLQAKGLQCRGCQFGFLRAGGA
jgi:UTP-glucose-1-phosphate uridylyltransferase